MTTTPPYEQLAKQYLDLWEQQLNATAREPGQFAEMIRLFTEMQQAFIKGNHARPAAAPANPATVSPDRDHELDELRRRVAECEARIAALETASTGESD